VEGVFCFDTKGDNAGPAACETPSGMFDAGGRRPFRRRSLRSISGVAGSSVRKLFRYGKEEGTVDEEWSLRPAVVERVLRTSSGWSTIESGEAGLSLGTDRCGRGPNGLEQSRGSFLNIRIV
jgi:hypothetical protein